MRFVLSLSFISLFAGVGQADSFDLYTNRILADAVKAKDERLLPVNEVTPELLARSTNVLRDAPGTFLIVSTNDQRYAKLLVRPARVKVGPDSLEPMILIGRFVTYREASDRAIRTSGEDRHLFPGFRFHLDYGQVVPERLGGDLVAEASDPDDPLAVSLKPLGDAKIWIVTEPLPSAKPEKSETLVVGKEFKPMYFTGTYQLRDDGRRSGELKLTVAEDSSVTGSLFSDRDGREYEVEGKVGTPRHAIAFTVRFPQTVQSFQGMMFTGDGKAIVGTSKLEGRETGFYATRKE